VWIVFFILSRVYAYRPRFSFHTLIIIITYTIYNNSLQYILSRTYRSVGRRCILGTRVCVCAFANERVKSRPIGKYNILYAISYNNYTIWYRHTVVCMVVIISHNSNTYRRMSKIIIDSKKLVRALIIYLGTTMHFTYRRTIDIEFGRRSIFH